MFYTQSSTVEVRFGEEPLTRVTIPFPQTFDAPPNVVVTPWIEQKELCPTGIVPTLVSISESQFVVDLLYIGNFPSKELKGNIRINWLAQCFIPEQEERAERKPLYEAVSSPAYDGDLTQEDIDKIRELLKYQKISSDHLTQMLDKINATHELILKNMR